MNEGILLLRILLGTLMAGHALQKLAGWFGGHGIEGTAQLFRQWGLEPARPMVAIAGISELAGAVLLGTGTATPVGVAFVVGTMIVAASVNSSRGLWAVNGGFELPLIYGLLGVGIGLVGPGRYSVDDHSVLDRITGASYVLTAVLLALLGSAPLVFRVLWVQRLAPTAQQTTTSGDRKTSMT